MMDHETDRLKIISPLSRTAVVRDVSLIARGVRALLPMVGVLVMLSSPTLDHATAQWAQPP